MVGFANKITLSYFECDYIFFLYFSYERLKMIYNFFIESIDDKRH